MALRILIFEDEDFAADQLKDMLTNYYSKIDFLEIIDNVKDGIEWLQNNPPPDLIMMDIHLADGICFEIFDYVKVQAPIIFTTAYSEYTLKAFKVNSIDYLLKPIVYKDLENALDKYKSIHLEPFLAGIERFHESLENFSANAKKNFRQRFLINVANKLNVVNSEDINYFCIIAESVFIIDAFGNLYPLDYTLEKVQKLVNPELFFRINRKYIIHINSIEEMTPYSQYRIKLKLKMCDDNDIIVSRERVKDFKNWLDK